MSTRKIVLPTRQCEMCGGPSAFRFCSRKCSRDADNARRRAGRLSRVAWHHALRELERAGQLNAAPAEVGRRLAARYSALTAPLFSESALLQGRPSSPAAELAPPGHQVGTAVPEVGPCCVCNGTGTVKNGAVCSNCDGSGRDPVTTAIAWDNPLTR